VGQDSLLPADFQSACLEFAIQSEKAD